MRALNCKLLLYCVLGLGLSGRTRAAAPADLQPIGPVTRVERTENGILLRCADNSEVTLAVLAADLIRVRAAFRQPLPARDHSWAVDKTAWAPVAWRLEESAADVRVITAELEVVVRRAPLLVEFRDAATHAVINVDQQPMAFDPKTGTVTAAKRLGLDEHFYGLGEKAARLDKRRGDFVMWTSDMPAYVEGTDPLYQSIPFYLGWQPAGVYGIFFDNSYRTHFDFGHASQEYAAFSAEGGELNYYFFQGPSAKKILGRYADLTGHMPLPPLWSLGHHQSRYSYYPDTLAEQVVRRYRADDLPLDVLHLDIHYMDGYRDFTWDPKRFPDPAAFTGRLNGLGVKVVTIVDPGVKYEPVAPDAPSAGYAVYNEGAARDFFLKRASGQLYVGRVWPGKSVFVDYTRPDAAHWWGQLHRALLDQGVAGIWMDMNEPADFDDRVGKSQGDVVFDDGGTHSPYAGNRNVFALGMGRATFEGLQRLRPDERPFVITRAGYAGIQRYSCMWTGDNTCTWESLALTLPMLETLGLSGEPFVGADVPGFRGNADGELLVRWYEVGFLAPLFRNHGENTAGDHEPWRFGPVYEDMVRKYLKLRYRLLPFIYTTMEEAHRTGVPLFRPLLLNYQDDLNVLSIDDEFMVGDVLLAAPIVRAGATSRRAYLPAGVWYDFWTGSRQAGGAMINVDAPLEKVPLFVRGGSIVPTGPEMNFTGEKPWDPLRFDIYPDERGVAAGSVYQDDGHTPAYQAGSFHRIRVSYASTEHSAKIVLDHPEGSFSVAAGTIELVLHSDEHGGEVLLDHQPLPAVQADAKDNGWFNRNGCLVIRIRSEERAREIEIRRR
jgi:alpha-glucosidase